MVLVSILSHIQHSGRRWRSRRDVWRRRQAQGLTQGDEAARIIGRVVRRDEGQQQRPAGRPACLSAGTGLGRGLAHMKPGPGGAGSGLESHGYGCESGSGPGWGWGWCGRAAGCRGCCGPPARAHGHSEPAGSPPPTWRKLSPTPPCTLR